MNANFRTSSIINAALALSNVPNTSKDFHKDVRKALCFAVTLKLAQYPYLSQMDANIVADYFTAPTVKVKKALRLYKVVIRLWDSENNAYMDPVLVRTDFAKKADAIRYAKEKVREVGPDVGAEAYISRDAEAGHAEYDACYNTISGLTVY
jgi:hypothetical protein